MLGGNVAYLHIMWRNAFDMFALDNQCFAFDEFASSP
jgi:hypothetical protein